MKRFVFVLSAVVIIGLLAGCAPVVLVQNNSNIVVRVAISSKDGTRVVSPAPGESVAADVSEGAYVAAVVPNKDWIDFAIALREALVADLANPEAMSPDQIIDITVKLSDITAKINQYVKTGGEAVGSCSGKASVETDGNVVVSDAENGSLAISCQ